MFDDVTTVLIVEDEMIVRSFAADSLTDAGYEVLEAEDADEAVRTLEKIDRISIVFTDIRMPGSMNGIEFAELVQSRWPDIRLLMTSGYPNLRYSVPPNCQFLAKPYGLAMLVSEIAALAE